MYDICQHSLQKRNLTGFLGSSTSRILRFSNGMIPRGSLSFDKIRKEWVLKVVIRTVFKTNNSEMEESFYRTTTLWTVAALHLEGFINNLTLLMDMNKYSLLCTQSNKGSCLSE